MPGVRDDTLDGVNSRLATTDRLETHYLESGGGGGRPVVFVHGNVSSSRFFEDVLAAVAAGEGPFDRGTLRAVAPDLRGYGDSETKPIDATRGLGDFTDDLVALLEALSIDEPVTLVGWSNGGGVAMDVAIDRPERVSSLVLVNPLSPYGFGGTKDAEGTPCFPDYAGSGGGLSNDEFVDGLANRNRDPADQASPLAIMRSFYVDPTYRFDPDREESYLTGMLDTATGDGNYPGDGAPSENWPGVAPGERGVNNAVSPKYCDLSGIVEIDPKPPIRWLRGENDQIVSNESLFDAGTLGRMGQLPDWPGEEAFPPQPMADQTRAVLEAYEDRGGAHEEVVLEGVGHTPHVEVEGEFLAQLGEAIPDA